MTLQERFEAIGGKFFCTEQQLSERLQAVNCFVFDWDGVFNNGVKAGNEGSPFSETDSMGINMLRFSYWLKQGKLPYIAIITGEHNASAQHFAKREHLNTILFNTKNKAEAIKKLGSENDFSADNTAFVFDDILDLSAAEICKLNFCVRQNASPLFSHYVTQHHLCDYITAHHGEDHAVREICELIIGLQGNYDETISKRKDAGNEYSTYLAERKSISAELLELAG